MPSIDVLLETTIPNEQLVHVLGQLFRVERDQVFIIYDVSAYPLCQGAHVVCNVLIRAEGFAQGLSLHWHDGDFTDDDAKLLSQLTASRIMLPVDDVNPYRMKLVTPRGEISMISVDATALDDQDIYTVVGDHAQ